MVTSFPALANVDIRLLRVFCSVVECGGFTQAQTELNLSRSTISTHMANLETRLGFRLCRRGRAGFSMTSRGQVVYEASRALLASIEGYHSQIVQLREQIVGEVTVGIVDNLITNRQNRLSEAIDRAFATSDDLRLIVRIAPPDQVEEQLIRGQLQLALTPGFRSRREVSQKQLFNEMQYLYCGRNHPLFDRKAAGITSKLIADQDFVRRGYVSSLTRYSSMFDRAAIAESHQMEGLAHFILSGKCLGFLPEDYASYWVERGEMRQLRPDMFRFEIPICIARDERAQHSLATSHVYETILRVHQK